MKKVIIRIILLNCKCSSQILEFLQTKYYSALLKYDQNIFIAKQNKFNTNCLMNSTLFSNNISVKAYHQRSLFFAATKIYFVVWALLETNPWKVRERINLKVCGNLDRQLKKSKMTWWNLQEWSSNCALCTKNVWIAILINAVLLNLGAKCTRFKVKFCVTTGSICNILIAENIPFC